MRALALPTFQAPLFSIELQISKLIEREKSKVESYVDPNSKFLATCNIVKTRISSIWRVFLTSSIQRETRSFNHPEISGNPFPFLWDSLSLLFPFPCLTQLHAINNLRAREKETCLHRRRAPPAGAVAVCQGSLPAKLIVSFFWSTLRLKHSREYRRFWFKSCRGHSNLAAAANCQTFL